MCVLSIKMPIQKKSGNLFNDHHVCVCIYIYIYIVIILSILKLHAYAIIRV